MDDQKARESLDWIKVARRQTSELRNYRESGSIVTAWGFVWLTGFGGQQFIPAIAHWLWLIGWALALIWTATRPRRAYDNHALATWIVAVGFVLLLLLVIRADTRTAAMVFGMVLAASYAVIGIWAGRRFAFLAAIVLIISCLGWWLFPQWLFGLLAIGGGGALIVGGIWLRRP